MSQITAIGLCGVARSGKDTFFSILKNYLADTDKVAVKVSFAKALRLDIREFLFNKTGIDSFTEIESEKVIIRDFLVAYGTKLMRRLDENYWISQVKNEVEEIMHQGDIPVFTDTRYPNELKWIKYILGGHIIHIERQGIVAPNEEERRNDPLLKNEAHLKFYWEDFLNNKPSVLEEMQIHQSLNHLFQKQKVQI